MGAELLDMLHSMLLLSLRLLAFSPAQTYHRAFVPIEVWYLKSGIIYLGRDWLFTQRRTL